MRMAAGLMWSALAVAAMAAGPASAREMAHPAGATAMPATHSGAATRGASDLSAQERRRRPITRLRVYPRYQPPADGVFPRYYPGPNAVRDCVATYAPEYRPSGTVITPRVSCIWRPG